MAIAQRHAADRQQRRGARGEGAGGGERGVEAGEQHVRRRQRAERHEQADRCEGGGRPRGVEVVVAAGESAERERFGRERGGQRGTFEREPGEVRDGGQRERVQPDPVLPAGEPGAGPGDDGDRARGGQRRTRRERAVELVERGVERETLEAGEHDLAGQAGEGEDAVGARGRLVVGAAEHRVDELGEAVRPVRAGAEHGGEGDRRQRPAEHQRQTGGDRAEREVGEHDADRERDQRELTGDTPDVDEARARARGARRRGRRATARRRARSSRWRRGSSR